MRFIHKCVYYDFYKGRKIKYTLCERKYHFRPHFTICETFITRCSRGQLQHLFHYLNLSIEGNLMKGAGDIEGRFSILTGTNTQIYTGLTGQVLSTSGLLYK